MWKKIAIGIGVFVLVAGAALAITVAAVSEERPVGKTGPEAEGLAATVEAAVNLPAWKTTRAIEWNFAGRRSHLWDRDRSFERMIQGDLVVWLDLTTRKGQAERDGQPLSGDELDEALQSAWEAWVNDAFWLNPIAKLRDDGVELGTVSLEGGGQGLLVSYASGGVTPGDAYLWIPGPEGRPKAWKMWTSVIPVGGAKASWEGWVKLETGAWISTRHDLAAFSLELTDIRAAASLEELYPDSDPFAKLN